MTSFTDRGRDTTFTQRLISFTHIMQLMIKPTSVTDRLSIGVSPPEGGGVRPAVGAARPLALGGGLKRQQRSTSRYGQQFCSLNLPGDVWV